MKKQLLALVLALLLCMGLAVTASAETTGTTGGCTWQFDSDTGVLTISGNGAMADYTGDNQPWKEYNDKITSVEIKNGVTSIGNYAFWKCTSLKSVTISEGVTTIGDNAFSDCSALNIVTIPDSVTTIGPYAFFGCSALESVTIPGSVTTIGNNAFMSCTSLTSVTISDGVNKTIGDNAFFRCSALTSVTIPGSVTSIGNSAFHSCGNLETVTIYNGVTTIGSSAFNSCGKLTTVTIPDSVTSIGSLAFSGCTALKSVTIPGSVTLIGYYAFYGCSKLETVEYHGLTEPNYEINVFDGTNGVAVKVPANYAGDTFATKNVEKTLPMVPLTYIITYMNSDSNPITGLTPGTYTSGEGATLPTLGNEHKPADVSSASQHFGGWYVDAAFTGSPVTAITADEWGDKTFFAKWEVIEYTVKAVVEPSDKGTVTLSNRTVVDDEDVVNGSLAAIMGNRISIVCKPVDGYVLKSLTATKDSDGSEVYLETASGIANRYFNMPASNVTVKAVFAPEINFTVKDISYPWNLKAYTVPQGTKFHDWREKNKIAESPDGATWQVARGTDVLDVTVDTEIMAGDCYFLKWVMNGNTLIIYGKVNANEDKLPADYDKYALHSVDGKEYCNVTISCKVNGEKYDFNITGTNGERNWYLSTAFQSKGITGTTWWLADCTVINSYTQMPLDQFAYYSQSPITIGWDRVNRHATFQYSDYYLQKNITQFTLRLSGEELTITGNPANYDLSTHVEDGREYSMVAQDSENKYISNWCAFSTVQHKVEFDEMENGTVTSDKQAAESGETVKLIVRPDKGYGLDTLSVMKYEIYTGEYTSVTLQADGSFVMPDFEYSSEHNSVLVAATFKRVNYYATFDANGGIGTMEPQTFNVGEAQKLSGNMFCRPGYTFAGWNTKADGSGTAYANGETVTLTEDITLYAQWRFIPIQLEAYTVRFDANGGEGAMDAVTYYEGLSKKLPVNGFVREGYTFDGWTTEPDGQGYYYGDGWNITVSEDMTLYAQWKKNAPAVKPEYKIEVDGSKGTVTRLNDTSVVHEEMYIRYAVSGTVDGEPFMVVDLIDVKWDETQKGVVGTFSVPNLQSSGSVDIKSFVITTDDSAHKHVISDVMPNAYGVLVK